MATYIPDKKWRVFIDGVKQREIRSATVTFNPGKLPTLILEVVIVDVQIDEDGTISATTMNPPIKADT